MHLAEWARRFGVGDVLLAKYLERADENIDKVFTPLHEKALERAERERQSKERRSARIRAMFPTITEIPDDPPLFMHRESARMWLASKGIDVD